MKRRNRVRGAGEKSDWWNVRSERVKQQNKRAEKLACVAALALFVFAATVLALAAFGSWK